MPKMLILSSNYRNKLTNLFLCKRQYHHYFKFIKGESSTHRNRSLRKHPNPLQVAEIKNLGHHHSRLANKMVDDKSKISPTSAV